MIIFGAGMAGLLAANMLRRFSPIVCEAQPSLPNNHEALLRFRTDAVAKATGIPFRRVRVSKAIQFLDEYRKPDLYLSNLYSQKVTGEVQDRSILDTASVDRYIAPWNFIEQLSQGVHITYDRPLTENDITQDKGQRSLTGPIISTIPMNALMTMMRWPTAPAFKWRPIWTVTANILEPVCDVYQTIYYPGSDTKYYRASITGNRLIIEYIAEPPIHQPRMSNSVESTIVNVLSDFGLTHGLSAPTPQLTTSDPVLTHQRYGKLLPTDDAERRRFILAMTDLHHVYSLGRFSTWRQILLDDVVQDVTRLDDWITGRDQYMRRLAQ